jgi:hypothetical protein
LHIGLCQPPCLNFLLCSALFFYSLDVGIRHSFIPWNAQLIPLGSAIKRHRRFTFRL